MPSYSKSFEGGVFAVAARWRAVVLVAVLSAVTVFSACFYAWQGQVREHRRQVQLQVDGLASAINQRLSHFKVALEMARGLTVASENVTREEWRKFTTSEGFFERVPGAYGFSYIHRVPVAELDRFEQEARADGVPSFSVFDTLLYDPVPYEDCAVIKYIEPLDRNRKALGLNVASIPVSSETMWRSVDRGEAVVSRRIHLQQTGQGQIGIVMYHPIFPVGADVNTVESRREAVTGWVAASIVMDDFMSHGWASTWRDMDVLLCEKTGLETDGELYASPGLAGESATILQAPRQSHFVSVIPVGGWTWELHARDPNPSVSLMTWPVIKVGVAGTTTGVLLVLLTWSLTRTRDRAQLLAEELTSSLRQSEQRYSLAVNGSQDGLWDWNLTTGTVYYAARWKELLGLEDEEIGDRPEAWFSRIASNALAEFHANLTSHIEGKTDRFNQEIEMIHADGTTRWMLCRAVAVRSPEGRAVRLAGSLSDITDLKHAHEKLQTMAMHDRLTGLGNRALLTERLRLAIARAKRDPSYRYALLFLDLDRFKLINDSMGHAMGDRLLVAMAERIRAVVREVNTVARFGGDEFVVLVEGVRDVEEAKVLSERLLSTLSKPFEFDACEIESTVSVGVVWSGFGYENADDVIRDADAAMYQAKAEGKARCCLFDSQMHTRVVRRLKLEQDLRRCDFSDQFCVYYQPLIDLGSSKVAGFEALVRWDHPEYGRIMPDEFIGIAEESGSIVELGEWVLNQACMQLAKWRVQYGDAGAVEMNVNVSKRQLMHADMMTVIRKALKGSGVPATSLKLEITESTVMDNPQRIVSVMQQIRSMGVRLSMDDFGTGHSSLSCLHQFPIDELKIDRSFINNMQVHREFVAVMDAIVMLAHFLRLDVVAEGIESEDQLAQLQAMDCGYGQGYLFAKPMPAEEATEYLGTHLTGYRSDTSDAA